MHPVTRIRNRIPAFALFLCAGLAARAFGGDFNGDGRDDLVVGVPFERVAANAQAGQVHVFYGWFSGVSKEDEVVLTEFEFGDVPTFGEAFGYAVATGDFDGDGFDDLAIGAPGEKIDGLAEAGVVFVIHGGPIGLDTSRTQVWSQDSKGVKDHVEMRPGSAPPDSQEAFGRVLEVGDFDGDGRDDLAIGVLEGLGKNGSKQRAGAVHVLYGSKSGLKAARNQLWHADVKGVPGTASAEQEFGSWMRAGDFNGDGRDDLAIGAPEDVVDGDSQGTVTILFGRKKHGLGAKHARRIVETDVGGAPDDGLTFFGAGLGAGDVDGDGIDELVIGAPKRTVSGHPGAGGSYVLHGSPTGPDAAGAVLWTQDTPGIAGVAADGEGFGFFAESGDFDGDGFDDVAIGVPGESVLGVSHAGGVHVLRGGAAGLTTVGNVLFHQGDGTLPEAKENGDEFGTGLARGDFDGNGVADLAIGAPLEDVAGKTDAGGCMILLGVLNTGLGEPGALGLDQSDPDVEDDVDDGERFATALGA